MESAWIEHAPFAMWLVDAVRPKVLVELGTHWGYSYFAFCQAVLEERLDTRCFAVDTWRGDESAGFYDEDVHLDVSAWNGRYEEFSTLVRSTFDEAVASFEDGSIDLLHIDGCHTYEAVRHDFETWLPRLSARGIVLLHDTHEDSDHFGVHRLWNELRSEYPSFAFAHGHGLGLLAVGENVAGQVAELTSLEASSPEAEGVRTAYRVLGHSIAERELLLGATETAREQLQAHERDIASLEHANAEAGARLDQERDLRGFEGYRSDWMQARLQARLAETLASAPMSWGGLRQMLGARARGAAAAHPHVARVVGRPARALLRRSLSETPADVNDYAAWAAMFEPSSCDVPVIRRFLAGIEPRRTISIAMAVCDPSPEHLLAALESVAAQVYERWELCIADDASTDPSDSHDARRWEDRDPRVHVLRREARGGISAALNSALTIVSGDYVGFLDHDDVLSPVALAHLAAAVSAQPDARLLYSDEDVLDENGERTSPYLKPAWNPSLILGQNYLCHFLVCDVATLRETGGFRSHTDGAQDWDAVLRMSETLRPNQIVHLPYVLYHWRRHARSTSAGIAAKPYAREAGNRAVTAALERRGVKAEVNTLANGWNQIMYSPPDALPAVDIVVPSALSHRHVELCLRRLLTTDYERLRVLLVVDEDVERERAAQLPADVIADPRFEVVIYPHREFNYSTAVNDGVRGGDSEFVCLFNDDVLVTDASWLLTLVSRAAQPGVAAAGAMLYYPDDTVQHGGVILGIPRCRIPLP